jgi:hypothetical protein
MNKFVLTGIIVLLITLIVAVGLIGWNLYTLTQANAVYGRGMMRGMMAQPDAATPYGRPGMMQGMMGRGGMMNRNGNPGAMMENCPCLNANSTAPTAPSNNSAPTGAPTPQAGLSSSAASSSASPKPADAFTGKAGNLNVTLTMNPKPTAFSTTTFDITLTDEKGNAVSDANVSLDLTMPSMYMPANKPQAKALGDGKYQAVGRFTMRGGWRININIERGGQKQNVYFDIVL